MELDPVIALRRLGTVSDGTTLRRLCDPWQIRVAVQEGRILRLSRNRYALPGVGLAPEAAGRLHGTVSHLSAAGVWGWKVKREPALPVITVPPNRKLDAARRAGSDVRWQRLADDEVFEGIVTTRTRTAADCLRTLQFDEALCVADSVLREGRVSRAELEEAVRRSPQPGRRQALTVLEVADGRAANPFESCLRAVALRVPRLHVEPQFVVPGIGHADLGDGSIGLLIEADSHEYHIEKDAFRYDIRRYTAMVVEGWTVARFCWEDAMWRQDRVHADLTRLVARLSPCGREGGCCGVHRTA